MVSNDKTILGGPSTPTLLKTKNIGDILEHDEFNAIIYLLKSNTRFNEPITIHNGKIVGSYGDYIFDLDSATINDQGILITQQTLNNLGNVKLENPIFENSRYTLHLTVTHIDSLNGGLMEIADNIKTTDLAVELKNGENIVIPFDRLELDYIVKFNGFIEITHDIPEIVAH